jgi:CRISPR-associated protein Cmr2
VLHADGDQMGKAIGELTTPEAHRAFSERLAHFASEAGRIVAQHNGALIYSGGDDVLAFLPLDTALACADALRRVFKQTVNGPSAKEDGVTLSVGLAIGHYGEHLQELVQWSRDAEKAAKNAGRNALAVALHTRSGGGEPVTVTASWQSNPLDRWQQWITWHREDRFPDGAAYELRELARELAEARQSDLLNRRFSKPGSPGREVSLVEAEVERILLRKEPRSGRKLSQDQVDYVLGALDTTDAEKLIMSLTRLVNELIISRRIATAVEVAGRAGRTMGGAING